jgi:hypothetical protein
MKIFKELKKLGYIHYSATTIEELDDLPLNSAERVSEQALVLRWFREKHKIFSCIMTEYSYGGNISAYHINGLHQSNISKGDFYTYEEAELACLIKLIELTKNK